jgi:Fe2+ transport system protein FeoA
MAKSDSRTTTLADLPLGQSAVVAALTGTGAQRDRLMDLGVLPGTRIAAEMRSPLGDPTAYRIRGALIALRREQAATILLTEAGRDQGPRIRG